MLLFLKVFTKEKIQIQTYNFIKKHSNGHELEVKSFLEKKHVKS